MSTFKTIPNIEVLEVGEDWHASTGDFTVTPKHLIAAVAAMDDPGVRAPILKLGHTDERFNGNGDGQPSFGRLTNLHVSENGMTLLGDLTGVPSWLAAALPTAYPRRSFEGFFNYTSATGKKHDLAITALSLLGEEYPAITTLEDIRAVFGAESIEDVQMVAAASGDGDYFTATPLEEVMAKKVNASVGPDEIRRAYYKQLGDDAWIHRIEFTPAQVIVEADNGTLYRIPYSVDAENVAFGEGTQVELAYIDTTGIAAKGQKESVVFSSQAESTAITLSNNAKETQEGDSMTPAQLEAIGLKADATEDDIAKRLSALVTLETQPPVTDPGKEGTEIPGTEVTPDESAPGADPNVDKKPVTVPTVPNPEVVPVEKTVLEGLKVAASRADVLWAQEQTRTRDQVLASAINAGKFPPARKEHWAKAYDADPEGVKATIAGLADGLVPLTEVGHGEDTQVSATAAEDAYLFSFLPNRAKADA